MDRADLALSRLSFASNLFQGGFAVRLPTPFHRGLRTPSLASRSVGVPTPFLGRRRAILFDQQKRTHASPGYHDFPDFSVETIRSVRRSG
jgi:hypothetical protein